MNFKFSNIFRTSNKLNIFLTTLIAITLVGCNSITPTATDSTTDLNNSIYNSAKKFNVTANDNGNNGQHNGTNQNNGQGGGNGTDGNEGNGAGNDVCSGSSADLTDYSKDIYITTTEWVDRLEANSYPGYGEYDYAADVVGPGKYIDYAPKVSNPSSTGFLRIKGAIHDLYTGSDPLSLKVIFNGQVVFSDGSTPFVPGQPQLSMHFTNWNYLEIPLTNIQATNTLVIANCGPAFLAIDSMEISETSLSGYTPSPYTTTAPFTNWSDGKAWLEGGAYPAYGEFDYKSDVAYQNQYLAYSPKINNPVANGNIYIRGAFHDLYSGNPSINIEVRFNGQTVFSGTPNPAWQKGTPQLSYHFTNWKTLSIPVSNIQASNTLKIINKSSDFIAIDNIQIGTGGENHILEAKMGNLVTNTNFTGFLDANAFESYGEFDYRADIAYQGEYLVYNPSSATTGNGYIRIKGVRHDLYEQSFPNEIKVLLNGQLVYDGSTSFQPGTPKLSGLFDNWKVLEIPVTNLQSNNHLVIANKGPDFIAIDSLYVGNESFDPLRGVTPSSYVTNTSFVDSLDLSGYPSYGEADNSADVAFAGQYLQYSPQVSNLTSSNGVIKIKGTRHDLYEGNRANKIKVILNGQLVFNGDTNFQPGTPKLSGHFTNWNVLEIPVSNLQSTNDLKIANRGPDFVVIDSIEVSSN